jgi:hypothetical protein
MIEDTVIVLPPQIDFFQKNIIPCRHHHLDTSSGQRQTEGRQITQQQGTEHSLRRIPQQNAPGNQSSLSQKKREQTQLSRRRRDLSPPAPPPAVFDPEASVPETNPARDDLFDLPDESRPGWPELPAERLPAHTFVRKGEDTPSPETSGSSVGVFLRNGNPAFPSTLVEDKFPGFALRIFQYETSSPGCIGSMKKKHGRILRAQNDGGEMIRQHPSGVRGESGPDKREEL